MASEAKSCFGLELKLLTYHGNILERVEDKNEGDESGKQLLGKPKVTRKSQGTAVTMTYTNLVTLLCNKHMPMRQVRPEQLEWQQPTGLSRASARGSPIPGLCTFGTESSQTRTRVQ